VPADRLNLMKVKTGTIQRRVLCLNEVFPAMFAEILLITTPSFPVFDDIFAFLDQIELTRRVLAGDPNGTARTGHARQ